jgi:hypothetical protein
MKNNIKIKNQIIKSVLIIILTIANPFCRESFSESFISDNYDRNVCVSIRNSGDSLPPEKDYAQNVVMIADAIKCFIYRTYPEVMKKELMPSLMYSDYQTELQIIKFVENKYQKCFIKNDYHNDNYVPSSIFVNNTRQIDF